MELEFIQGEKALRNSGSPLREGEAFLVIDGKEVKQEIIDRFNSAGQYVGERPTGIMGKLIVNLYKISIEIMDAFNEHVPGLKMVDIENKDSFIELALIPSKVHKWNGEVEEDWYISERMNDPLYSRPSSDYRKSIEETNRQWGKSAIDEDQSN